MRKTILVFVTAIVIGCFFQLIISCNQYPSVVVSENENRSCSIDYYLDTVAGHVVLSTIVRDKSGNFVGVSSFEIKD